MDDNIRSNYSSLRLMEIRNGELREENITLRRELDETRQKLFGLALLVSVWMAFVVQSLWNTFSVWVGW